MGIRMGVRRLGITALLIFTITLGAWLPAGASVGRKLIHWKQLALLDLTSGCELVGFANEGHVGEAQNAALDFKRVIKDQPLKGRDKAKVLQAIVDLAHGGTTLATPLCIGQSLVAPDGHSLANWDDYRAAGGT